MLQSARRKISYPNPDRSDRPDVPAHILNLVSALEVDVVFTIGLDSDRAASTHQVGGGRLWWSNDTGSLWWDDGAAWHQLGNATLDSPVFVGAPQAPTPGVDDDSTAIATTEYVRNILPAGVIVPYVGASAPAGWLICNGALVNRGDYPALNAIFAAQGYPFGAGNGTTTMGIPDFRGRVPVGLNTGTFNVMGKVGGEETHVMTTAEMPSHTHTVSSVSAGTPSGVTDNESANHDHSYTAPVFGNIAAGSTNIGATGSTTAITSTERETHAHGLLMNALPAHTHTNTSTGGGGSHNNLQPYITTNFIIKT